jgi:hypothetical protein
MSTDVFEIRLGQNVNMYTNRLGHLLTIIIRVCFKISRMLTKHFRSELFDDSESAPEVFCFLPEVEMERVHPEVHHYHH